MQQRSNILLLKIKVVQALQTICWHVLNHSISKTVITMNFCCISTAKQLLSEINITKLNVAKFLK